MENAPFVIPNVFFTMRHNNIVVKKIFGVWFIIFGVDYFFV